MPIHLPKSAVIRTGVPKPATAGMPGSRLSSITATYRQQQAAQNTATTKSIDQLSTQRRRLATAEVKSDKPIDTYLQRSGQLVERRIGSLQAHLDQIMGKNQSE